MKRALDTVNDKILAAVKRRNPDILAGPLEIPRLVAVSKLQPVSAIIEAYECGQRHFGENYIQELEAKSNDPQILEKCPDIKFHFIGHLQSNKVNKLLKVRNLYCVETIDSIKLADLIDKAIERYNNDTPVPRSHRLNVFVQVNVSGEEQKNGVGPLDFQVANYIYKDCRSLRLAGLMTIGKLDGWQGDGPHPEFLRLYETRETLSRFLMIEERDLELSMGMSSDFEQAIEQGSTNVRVGTLIFGERPPKG